MPEKKTKENMNELIESLSPNERQIVPCLSEGSMEKIAEKTEMNKAAVLRSLEFLSNKKVIELIIKQKKVIDLGVNGLLYKKKGLPERILLNLLHKHKSIELGKATKQSGLNNNEFKAALGALKKRAMINLINEKIILNAKASEITKTALEEQLLHQLPKELDKLEPEQRFALDKLKNRKEIVQINNVKKIEFKLTELGQKLMQEDLSIGDNLLESLTPELLRSNLWKTKKFRRYDVEAPVPKIYGGKRHFLNQAVDYGRKIWTDLGFKEMTGTMVQAGFWNFDALFTPQDHPVREMQDTFYIKSRTSKLPEKEVVDKIASTHEKGISGSKGWRYKWKQEPVKKVVLRTHTTCLSAQTLHMLSKLPKEQRKGKFFAIGPNFRNETIDWSHGFEFNQTEGIVIDPDANFRHLLGYLQEFYKKMGFEKVRFQPAYFPYTEPSVEVAVWHPEKKTWLEFGGAGIFRPEVTIPLLGEWIPVLAWGQGFDRIAMDEYAIKDLREMHENDITKLRQKKKWMRC